MKIYKINNYLPLDFILILFFKLLFKYRFLFTLEKILKYYIEYFFVKNFKFILLLANTYSQLRNVKKEQSILKKSFKYIKNDDEEIARLGYCSVIVKDFLFLKKLLIYTKKNKILNLYLRSLHKSRNTRFIDFASFLKVGYYYKKKEPLKNYIKLCLNFSGYNKKNVRNLNSFHIKKKQNILTKKCFVLISCDFDYFKIFSKYYIANFRLQNTHVVHFHIISNESRLEIINAFDSLQKKYNNLGLSIEKERINKNIVYITLSRFLVAAKLINFYKSDVFVNDIDLTPKYNLDLIYDKMHHNNYNIGLYDDDQRIPWTRFAAGICYFKYKDKISSQFLVKLSEFYNYKIKNYKNLYWSADQLGLTIAHYNLRRKIKVMNLFKYKRLFNINKVLFAPRLLAIKKIKAKFKVKKFDE